MIELVPLCTMTLMLSGTGGCRERPYRATRYRRDRQRQPVRAADRQPDRRRQRRLAHQDPPADSGFPDVRIAIRTTDEAVVLMRYFRQFRWCPAGPPAL